MSIADKLQKLIDGKQYVVDKVNAKSGSELTLNSKWQDIGDTVDNITGGSGIDTTDATATASDMLKGKTAYAKGEKIEGNIETYDGEFEGEAKESKSLKAYLDIRKSAGSLFSNMSTMTSEQLAEFIPSADVTENVTTMSNMFSYCHALQTIPQLDTSQVTNMQMMFQHCSALPTIPQLDTSSCTNMNQIFLHCLNLTAIPQLDTSKVTNMQYMFSDCYILPKIDISHFNISSSSYSNYMCCNCYSLKAVIIRSFGDNYVLNSNAFTNCYHILGTTNATYNPNGDKDGYIYIPREWIETLSSATNWATHASQFRALEDYTKDGTTTGEFDDEKAGLTYEA